MHRRFNQYFSDRFVPRWAILALDLFIIVVSFIASYFIRHNFNTAVIGKTPVILQVFFVIPITLISFYIFKPYNGIIRHTATRDIQRIVYSLFTSAGLLSIITWIARSGRLPETYFIPFSVLLIHFMLSSFVMTWLRLVIRMIFQNFRLYKKTEVRVMIMGAGELGQVTMTALVRSSNPNYKLIGFIDDNVQLQGKTKAGIPIYSFETTFGHLIRTQQIDEMILAINTGGISDEKIRFLMDLCISNKIAIKRVPPVNDWLSGHLNARQLRPMNIEDLLGREVIAPDSDKIQTGLKGAVIMVTGGAGSIGSELVRQLLLFEISKVLIVDQAESALFELRNELLSFGHDGSRFEAIVGDVTNSYRMVSLFERYHPELVFNAAAYKHVPLMEEHPFEAIRVNVGGVHLMANLSIKYGVKKFVMISTDKAVNPTNVMGASKRICEMYIQSQSQVEGMKTQFITTRFGNVLGSNGSVVPIFKKQIANGGPLMLTHRDITRYFMTIPEACQLVLEAGFMGSGGEIFVFDMGKPVKIYDLAVKMIKLAGLEPGRDIEIRETGLRPGEKLYEELLSTKENTIPTHHGKIMIGKRCEFDPLQVHQEVIALLNLLNGATDDVLVSAMKKLVPEYLSHNSTFERLDHTNPVKMKKDVTPLADTHVIPLFIFNNLNSGLPN